MNPQASQEDLEIRNEIVEWSKDAKNEVIDKLSKNVKSYVRKRKKQFLANLEQLNDIDIEDVVTYTLDETAPSVPAWITAVKNNIKN